ncbi:MAG: hypothetical protein MUO67_02350 [Anaerolineales bacterium]|nr:hypothetical protein [Anaerolineales bacterium]
MKRSVSWVIQQDSGSPDIRSGNIATPAIMPLADPVLTGIGGTGLKPPAVKIRR